MRSKWRAGAGVDRSALGSTSVPTLAQAESLAQAGFSTGASQRNWASYGEAVVLPEGLEEWRRRLLTDPQTSGGLLVACDAAAAPALCDRIRRGGYPQARIIGTVERGDPVVRVDRAGGASALSQ